MRYDSLDSTISKSESKVDKKTIFSLKNYQNFEIPTENTYFLLKSVPKNNSGYFWLKLYRPISNFIRNRYE